MSFDMDRRNFMKLALGAIAAAYVPEAAERVLVPAKKTVLSSKVVKEARHLTHEFVITGAEWSNMYDRFARAFTIVGHFKHDPSNQLYVASQIDEFTIREAINYEAIIKSMLENMERQVTSHAISHNLLKDGQNAYFVYSGELKRAMEKAGVPL